MNVLHIRQLIFLCFFCGGWWRATDASHYQRLEDGLVFRTVRDDEPAQISWRDDEDQQQVQNLFKRFLFHYSKAKTSTDPSENMKPSSIHPLMRLSPKLSQRRKKTVVLLNI